MGQNPIQFFKNIWRFRKVLWQYRTWDYSYNLLLFRESLIHLQDSIRNGYEEIESRNAKVESIQDVIDALYRIANETHLDEYIEKDIELTCDIFDKIDKAYVKDWDIISETIKGNGKLGSDMRGWWT